MSEGFQKTLQAPHVGPEGFQNSLQARGPATSGLTLRITLQQVP